jgi:N-acetyl-alpha-D-muramate 1-phosphate uridylyltransferase
MLPVAILAGGLGTRLYPVTQTIPKILVDFDGRSFAEHQLDWLQREGVTHVVYCLGHLGEQVVAAIGDGSRWGMHFDVVMDGPRLLGTGGALRRALPQLGERFFVLYGDSLLTCSLAAVEQAYVASERACLMTVYPNENRWDRSNVIFRGGRIVTYDKRHPTPEMRHIDYGLGIVAGRVLLDYPADQPLDLARVYQDQLQAGELAGYEVTSRFYEIGSPEGLEETRAYLAQRRDAS